MDPGEAYLEIVLRFSRLAPGLVESYVGPTELAERVQGETPLTEPELAEQAGDLRGRFAHEVSDVGRGRWLDAQLQGIEAACDWLSGVPVSYRDLVERCYEVQPVEVAESQFEAAHDLLAAALPGGGSLRERYQDWMATQLVTGDQLVNGLQVLATELGRRTAERWHLPEGEAVEFEIVRGRPWAANASYRGGLRTCVAVNDELPIPAWRMVELVAHEVYPGHHTEAVCKADRLVRQEGRAEFSVWVYPTPQALIAEGIAMVAPEILLGEEMEEVAASCLRPLGVDYEVTVSAAVRRAAELLLPVRTNLAMMLDEERIDRDGALAYARRWRLEDDAYVERVLGAMMQREWPPYDSCYPEGLNLCRRFVDGDPERFGRLLREQLTPAVLVA